MSTKRTRNKEGINKECTPFRNSLLTPILDIVVVTTATSTPYLAIHINRRVRTRRRGYYRRLASIDISMASERILEGDSLGKCDSPPSEDLNITDLAVDCAKLFTRALDYINTTDEAPRLKGPLEELQRRFCDWATYLGVSENTVIDRILRIGYRDLFLLALDMLRFNILHCR
jgi:hypothetical protein